MLHGDLTPEIAELVDETANGLGRVV